MANKYAKDPSLINGKKAVIIGSTFALRQNYIVRRNIWLSKKEKVKGIPRSTDANLKDKSHTGVMSPQSQKKIRCAVNWLCASAQQKWIPETIGHKGFYFKINFITLTLPCTNSHITHNNIFKLLLEKFLDNARENWGLNLYTWKIELQKNGSPHVHIASDTYIHYRKLRTYWNKLLQKEGVLQHYQNKHAGCKFEQYLKWYPPNDFCDVAKSHERWTIGKKTNWSDPNTTDIHSVLNVKDLPAYISKYMAKDLIAPTEVNDLVPCEVPRSTARMWGCSLALSRMFKASEDIYDGDFQPEDSCFYKGGFIIKQIMGNPNKMGLSYPVADVIFMNDHLWRTKAKGRFYKFYVNAITRLRNAHKSDHVVSMLAPQAVHPLLN